VVYRRAQAGSASHLQAPAETRPARLVARVGRPVGATQMTHQADHIDQTALLTTERGPAQPGPLGGIGTVTGHPYIQVQVHPAAVPCCHGSARDRAEVPEAGHREVDSRLQRVPEVGVHRVEPAQHRRRETSLSQRQAFGDASYPEPRRPVLQRRAGRWDAAVPETVRFHHGHHLALVREAKNRVLAATAARSTVSNAPCAQSFRVTAAGALIGRPDLGRPDHTPRR